MSNKRIKELESLTKDELVSRIRETSLTLFRDRMQKEVGQLASPSSLWAQRKDLARMKMLLSAKSNEVKNG